MFNVAIVGKMSSGKSSLANYLIDVHKYTRASNAGAIKALASMAYGPIDKGETYEVKDLYGPTRQVSGREILQDIGDIVKEFDRDFWLKAMARDMATKRGPFVCDDVRFSFEAEHLRSERWIIVKLYVAEEVRMERYHKLYGRYPTNKELGHISETEVDSIEEDLAFSGEWPTEEIVNGILDHEDWREANEELPY